jgi:hypothetical protein
VVHDRVVGLGAWCDFVPEDDSLASPGSVCFDVHEFAELAGGQRLTLHTERGFGVSGPGMTAEQIESGVRTTVLPDDVDSVDDHPYEWLRELLRLKGIVVSTEALRAVPYTVEFSDRLRQLMNPAPS